MTPRVLVAYATKQGSTRDVAEAIADRLAAHGLRTVMQPARHRVDLRTFDGVVLGGALYTGRWHRDARRFLRRQRRARRDAIAAWADEVAGRVSGVRVAR